jgi:transcriptional regulator with XRE-family HTH domain
MTRGRIESNLAQQELAMLAGVAQGDINRLEIGAGEKGPTFDTLVRVAHAQGRRLVVELVPLVEADHTSIGSEEDENAEAAEAAAAQQILREAF